MFGLIIVLGIIVDDAIVIGENIYRHVEDGMPAMRAAVHGSRRSHVAGDRGRHHHHRRVQPAVVHSKGESATSWANCRWSCWRRCRSLCWRRFIILPAHLCHLPSPRKKSEVDIENESSGRWEKFQRRYAIGFLHGWMVGHYERMLRFCDAGGDT